MAHVLVLMGALLNLGRLASRGRGAAERREQRTAPAPYEVAAGAALREGSHARH